MKLFISLKYRPFALLWSGQTISRLGDSLYQIALAWWVLEKTDSASAMSMVFIFAFVPKILFVLIGGIVVDRFPRAQVMLLADLLRGVLISFVAFLAFTHFLEIWHIYIISILFGFVDAFFLPAYTALLPDLVPNKLLPSANSLTSLSAEITGVIGPALGAFIVSWGGTPAALALDGLSFFISALCVWPLLPGSTARPTNHEQTNVLEDLRQGFSTVLASVWLWMTIMIFALLNFTGRSPMNVALPFLVKESLHAEVGLLGLLYSTFSLGSIIGAAWLGRLSKVRRRGLIVYLTLIIVGLATLALGLPITLMGVVMAIFILGVSLAINNLVWSYILQEYIPSDVLGRVASINLLGSTGLLPLGFGLTGWATDHFGPEVVFVVGGLLTAGLAALGLIHPAIRDLE
jgi:DHA3 family tetracycline resistance protein-like MFS transporter